MIKFISLLFLVSCTDFPIITPQERCFFLLDTQSVEVIKEVPYYTGQCRCRMYSWDRGSIGPVSEPISKPLNYCDKFAGFGPDSTGVIYKFQEEVRLWLIRKEKNPLR